MKPNTLELDHQSLLDIVRMSAMLFKLSDRFFSQHGVTKSQFAVLMAVNEVGEGGLTQQELSERLVVHKSNVTGLIDRLEKKKFVARKARPGDRRCNVIVLGPNGVKVLQKVQGPYLQEVQRMMSCLTTPEKEGLRNCFEKLKSSVNNMLGKGPKWPLSIT